MADYTAYNTIISQVITDFDSIYDALRNKSVVNNLVEGSQTQLSADTTGIKTADYPALIRTQLFRIANVVAENGVVHTGGVINNYSGSTEAIDGGTVAFNGSNATITLTVKNAGYYDTTSKFAGSIGTETVNLTGVLNDASTTGYELVKSEAGGQDYYRAFAAANKILKEVTVAKGTLNITFGKDNIDLTTSTTVEAALGANGSLTGSLNGSVKTSLAEGDDGASYQTITVKSTAKSTASTTATPSISDANFKAGYISNKPTLTAVSTESEEEIVDSGTTIYLPKGSIGKAQATGGDLAFGGDITTIGAEVGADEVEDTTNNYYVSATSAETSLVAATTAGWVESGAATDLGKVQGQTKKIKIAKGKVSDLTGEVTLDKLTNASNLKLDSTDADAYEVTVGATAETVMNGTVKGGYIADGAKHTATATVEDKVLKIAKGKAATVASLTGIKYDDANGIVVTDLADTDGYYSIDPKISVSVNLDTDASKEGYLKPDTSTVVGTGLTDAKLTGHHIYIKHGSVAIAHDATIEGSTTGLAASGLSEKQPTSGNYFTISTSCTKTVAEGYIKSADVTENEGKKYYLPEAKVEFTTNADGGKFVQVKTAGYLPAGVIEAIEGNIDEAVVNAVLSSDILSTGTVGNGYAISISKSLSDSDAGYISATQGTLKLDQTYYVAKGSAKISPVITSIVKKGEIVANATGDKYVLTVTASGDNTAASRLELTEGYIKAADVTMNAIADKDGTIELDKAILEVKSGAATLNAVAATGVETATGESKYYVTPKLQSSGAIKAVAKTTGYIVAGTESDAGEMTAGTETPLYLKVGATTAFTGASKALTTANWDSNLSSNSVSGDYTISLKDATAGFTGTLETGYYGAAEQSIAVSQAITGSFTVAHGKAVVKASSATLDIAPTGFRKITDLTLEDDQIASHYVSVGGSITALTLSNNGSKDGYIKLANAADWDIAQDSFSNVTAAQVYIKKYQFSEDAAGNTTGVATTTFGDPAETVYNPTGEGIVEDTVIHTANTYADKNIVVKLHANAVGSNAVTDLEKLQRRLAGELARGA